MVALSAPEKLRRRLVRGSRLQHPPHGLVVVARWAGHSYRRQSLSYVLFVHDFQRRATPPDLLDYLFLSHAVPSLYFLAALGAGDGLAGLGPKARSAVRTELQSKTSAISEPFLSWPAVPLNNRQQTSKHPGRLPSGSFSSLRPAS